MLRGLTCSTSGTEKRAGPFRAEKEAESAVGVDMSVGEGVEGPKPRS